MSKCSETHCYPSAGKAKRQKRVAMSVLKEFVCTIEQRRHSLPKKKKYVWQKYKQNDKRIRMWKRLNIIL